MTLHGDGRLRPTLPQGAPNDQYTYDPSDPTPAWPGHLERWSPQALSLDQRFVQARHDVLVYTGEPLEHPLEVIGYPSVVLYVSSDAPDTDFYVTLCDVHPDGHANRLAWSQMRTRYRESPHTPTLMTPGEIYPLKFDLSPVAIVFKPGHRIRVDVRSANFPLYDRNPNTGAPIHEGTETRIARQTVYHDAKHPSHILLPIIR
jgi:hypothetical protein